MIADLSFSVFAPISYFGNAVIFVGIPAGSIPLYTDILSIGYAACSLSADADKAMIKIL